MGIVAGTAAEIGAEAAAEAAAEATAEAAAETAAEEASEAVAEAVAEGTAEAAAETAAEAATEAAVETGVQKVADTGASQIVLAIVRANLLTQLMNTIMSGVIQVVSAHESGDDIKDVLQAMKDCLDHAKANTKTWNKQISDAVKANKLQEVVGTPPLTMPLSTMFSASMNDKIQKFTEEVSKSMTKVQAAAKYSPDNLDKIKQAAAGAQNDFLKFGQEYLTTVKQWDAQEDAIKTEAGVNFEIPQLDSDLVNVGKVRL